MAVKRSINQLTKHEFDLVIIGGGISGVCIAYEAALLGYQVALIEKNDFGSATSAATSKLVHGGLRYLKQMDFGVVRESLRERRTLMEKAPHLVYPFPFLIPTYKRGNMKWMIRLGLTMYDILAYDRNRIRFSSKKMPKHQVLSKKEVLEIEPGVNQQDLTGGVLYYDAQMPDPNRLTWLFAASARAKGALLVNYAELIDFSVDFTVDNSREEVSQQMSKKKPAQKKGAKIRCAIVQDNISGDKFEVQAKLFINAAGPWADKVLSLSHGQSEKQLIRSKGIHIITKPIVSKYAVALRTQGGRHFFIIPWRGHSLIGTTDVEYKKDPDSLRVTQSDIRDFIAEVNASYSGANLSPEDVLHSYAGIRPLVDTDTKVSSYKASRKYEIYDHSQEDNLQGLVSVIGGKYTTSRQLGMDVLQKIKHHLPAPKNENPDRMQPLLGGDTGDIEQYIKEELLHNHYGLNDVILEYQIRNYGTQYKEVLGLADDDSSLLKPILPDQKEIWAQLKYAVEYEMAQTLTDLLMRRTGTATIRNLDHNTIQKIVKVVAPWMGWDQHQIKKQIQDYFDTIEVPIQ